MNHKTHIKVVHELYGTCFQHNMKNLGIHHLTPLLVLTMPSACWFSWRVDYILRILSDVLVFNVGLCFEGLF